MIICGKMHLTSATAALLFSACAFGAPSRSPLLNSSYVNPTYQATRSTIDKLSNQTIHALLASPSFPSGWVGQAGRSAVAQWDYLFKTRTFYVGFKQNETDYAQHPGGCQGIGNAPLADCSNNDAAWAATAVFEGYEAYGDAQFLNWAKGVHAFVSDHGFINNTVLQEGYLKGTHFANNTLVPKCGGQSMYGGVYEENGSPRATPANRDVFAAASDPRITSGATAVYALMSAQLCLVTNTTSYCDRARDALAFIDHLLVDAHSGFVRGPLDGRDCSRPDDSLVIHATANYIAAYALLGNVTGDASALARARATALAAMTTDVWNTRKGVLYVPSASVNVTGIKSLLVRRLHLVSRFLDTGIQGAIRQYINVQYWSAVNFASDDPARPVLYAQDWRGPAPSGGQADGEALMEALDILNSLVLNPDDAFPDADAKGQPVVTVE